MAALKQVYPFPTTKLYVNYRLCFYAVLVFSIFIGAIKQNPAGEADCQLHGI